MEEDQHETPDNDQEPDPKDARPRRGASQITDFKIFHRTGSTGAQGKVAAAIQRIETPEKEKEEGEPPSSKEPKQSKSRRALSGDDTRCEQSHWSEPLTTHTEEMSELEKLKEELKRQKEANEQIKAQLEEERIRNELEMERNRQKEWQLARDRLQEERVAAQKAHEEALKKLAETKPEAPKPDTDSVEYLKAKLAELQGKKPEPDIEKTKKQQEVADQLKELMRQQQQIATAAKEAAKEFGDNPQIQDLLSKLEVKMEDRPRADDQAKLMEQLLNTLQGKEPESHISKQKEILRQFLVDANKVSTTGGATTLKPDLLKKLSGESDTFHMAEWLAKKNRHFLAEEEMCDNTQEECKHHKKRSGMLDKATTNIQHKEIWPQKNLLEDWADEEMEFKHMQFEHFVAGESRTIEMCTEPAQILGCLRLLRRMAYAKLRGYEWPLIRKMYAAILRSIETKENTWDNNFDRYETILYKRAPVRREERREERQQSGTNSAKKWFCRDWNKGNCSRTAPHKAWFGSGTNAVQRTVLHMCAICYMKEKAQKDHPEGHDSCPHKEA